MSELPVEVGIAQLTHPGETDSGDRCVVKVAENRVVIGVIDGLGHGAEAALAAQAAADVVETFSHESVGALMVRCHERLRKTRGAAITLIAIDVATRQLDWLGAGNVAAVLLHFGQSGTSWRKELLVRSGTAGASLPSMAVSSLNIERGDVVAAATDGVNLRFIDDVRPGLRPQQLAESLLARHQTARDDALVVVARLKT